MRKINWKICIGFLTFFFGTFLALILFGFETSQLPQLIESKINPSLIEVELEQPPIISLSEFKDNENKTLATVNVISNNTKENNSPIYIKDGGKFCEKYLLKKVAVEKSASNQLTRLKNFNPDDESLLSNVKKWLKYVHSDKLQVFELKENQQKALLLSSTSYSATGLATSLERWHIEIENFYSDGFWSFSANPKLVFWDKKGLLNYYLVIYSDNFLSTTSKRDYENLTFNIERYKINPDGKTQLINVERNLNCK